MKTHLSPGPALPAARAAGPGPRAGTDGAGDRAAWAEEADKPSCKAIPVDRRQSDRQLATMGRLSLLLALLVGEGLTFQAPTFLNARPSIRSKVDLVDDSAAGHDLDQQLRRDDAVDVDSATRRRLVLSLIASSSLAPLVGNAVTLSSSSNTIAAATAAAAAATQYDDKTYTVIKPPLDKREYLTYTMPNGLNVLLVSDPASTTAACAMNVQ